MNTMPGQFNPQGNSDWLMRLLDALMRGHAGASGPITTPQPPGGRMPYDAPPMDRTTPDQGTVQPGQGPWTKPPMPRQGF